MAAKRSQSTKRTKSTRRKAGAPAEATPREGSTMHAAIVVLRGRRNPMSAAEIYAEIRRRRLAPGLKGKTPVQTVAAQLATHAKRGLYVERTGPGRYRLRRTR
jgi:hypothetical protein